MASMMEGAQMGASQGVLTYLMDAAEGSGYMEAEDAAEGVMDNIKLLVAPAASSLARLSSRSMGDDKRRRLLYLEKVLAAQHQLIITIKQLCQDYEAGEGTP